MARNKPRIPIPELANAMKIQPNYLYRVLPKLAADGQASARARAGRLRALSRLTLRALSLRGQRTVGGCRTRLALMLAAGSGKAPVKA
jgi:hypothetical protein